MSILIDSSTRIIVQGITGRRGRSHALEMLNSGSQLVGGTSPGNGGEWCFDGRVPVFDTVKDCVDATDADVSLVFVPPHSAADAILESIDCGIKTIVSITSSIPLQDMMMIKVAISKSDSILVGPNSPGVFVPGVANAGIFPADIALPGIVGLISRSGTLCYEALEILTAAGIGISTAIGLGDDPISGMDFLTCLELFEADPHTDQIVLIGGPGGNSEFKAASYILEQATKPVITYMVGENLSPDLIRPFFPRTQRGSLESSGKKIAALSEAGAKIAKSLADVPSLINH